MINVIEAHAGFVVDALAHPEQVGFELGGRGKDMLNSKRSHSP
jgi:hypothetical protein